MRSRRLLRLLLVGLITGPMIAWTVAELVYYYPAQEAATRRGDVLDYTLWHLLVIGLIGAGICTVAALTIGSREFPQPVRDGAVGGLVGVGAVVLGTFVLAHALGDGGLLERARYMQMGRSVAPIGLIAGILGGLIIGSMYRVGERRNRGKGQS